VKTFLRRRHCNVWIIHFCGMTYGLETVNTKMIDRVRIITVSNCYYSSF